MDAQVIYFSQRRKGNTRKIADAIASWNWYAAEYVDDAHLRNKGVVFLVSGCYAGKPGKKMTEFIEENTFVSRPVALFGTSGRCPGTEVVEMKTMVIAKGESVKDTFFW